MVEIATSLLDVKKEDIIKTIYNLETAGANYFHIDVMDGEFVKNNTKDTMMEYTQYIKQVALSPIEVHLMVKDVDKYVKQYIDLNVDFIIFHIESIKNENKILNLISYIKENNIKVGIAINPKTKVEEIYKYLPYIHKVLIMCVEPGMGGQKLIPETIEKIKELNVFSYEQDYDIDIEVDGGINDITAKDAVNAGANILVAGSYIIKSNDYKEAIKKLKQ